MRNLNLEHARLEPAAELCARAGTYLNLEKYGDAVRLYSRLIEMDPEDAEAYTMRGGTFLDMKRYKEAIQDCTKAIKLAPVIAELHARRGVCLRSSARGELDAGDGASRRRGFTQPG